MKVWFDLIYSLVFYKQNFDKAQLQFAGVSIEQCEAQNVILQDCFSLFMFVLCPEWLLCCTVLRALH